VLEPLAALLRRLGNPLRSEAAAFRWLIAIVSVLVALVLVVKLVT
jgi:hypothetical protein